jgi:hypothetical protein
MADGDASVSARRLGDGTGGNTSPEPNPAMAVDQSSSAPSSEDTDASLQQGEDRYQEIQVLAHKLWKIRGEPIGSPEIDWIQAEEEIRAKRRR